MTETEPLRQLKKGELKTFKNSRARWLASKVHRKLVEVPEPYVKRETEEPADVSESVPTKTVITEDKHRCLFRDKLVAFYEKNNPSKLSSVDKHLETYQGREIELFAKLEAKYLGNKSKTSSKSKFPEPCGSEKDPRCFIDISIGSSVIGRIIMQVYADEVPLAAENFRALCTGEMVIITLYETLGIFI